MITTAGKVSEYATTGFEATPIGITPGSDGNLWYVGSRGPSTGSRRPSTSRQGFSYAGTQADDPTGITVDANGKLWFTQQSDDQVGVFDPATDVTTEFTLPTSNNKPLGITLARMAIPTMISSPSTRSGLSTKRKPPKRQAARPIGTASSTR